MIGIIAYGSGNVAAIMTILKRAGIPHFLSGDPVKLTEADRFILPGVGAFDTTMENLESSGIIATLNEEVIGKGKKVLGICVGMHLLAKSSDEGKRPGLGWIPGRVKRIDTSLLSAPPHLPHMGWNSIRTTTKASLFEGIDQDRGFYFLHSYYFDASDEDTIAADVEYGATLPCAVERDNIFGVQFHPEKSHSNGTRLLTNFAGLA